MEPTRFTEKLAGGAMIAATALGLALMAHHPTLGSPGYESLAEEIAAEAPINRFVHGAMIVFLLAYQFGMTGAGRAFNPARATTILGGVLFKTAIIAMIGAALASGFLPPLLAGRLDTEADAGLLRSALALTGAINQTLAPFSVMAFGAAIAFYSLDLLARAGMARLVGLCGVVIGIALSVAIATGALHLSVSGMTIALLAFGFWFSCVGAALIGGALRRPQGA